MSFEEIYQAPVSGVIQNTSTIALALPTRGVATLSLLTGMMGGGKSSLGKILTSDPTVHVIDSDSLAKRTVYEDNLQANIPLLAEIFGKSIFVTQGRRIVDVDLKAVASIFFSAQDVPTQFSAAFGLQITEAIQRQINEARKQQGCKHVIVENAVAIENGWAKKFPWNHIISVVCSKQKQKERVMGRGITEEDMRRRLLLHYDEKKKVEVANLIVINNGEERDLTSCAKQLLCMIA